MFKAFVGLAWIALNANQTNLMKLLNYIKFLIMLICLFYFSQNCQKIGLFLSSQILTGYNIANYLEAVGHGGLPMCRFSSFPRERKETPR